MANIWDTYCDSISNEGKIKRLRLAFAADVISTAVFDSDIEELSPANFVFFENWIADFDAEYVKIQDYKVMNMLDDAGRNIDAGLVVIVPTDVMPASFAKWWRLVKRRHLVAEILNYNDVGRLLLPMEINYEYVLPNGFGEAATYKFTLKPTRKVDYNIEGVSVNAIASSGAACEILEINAQVLCLI